MSSTNLLRAIAGLTAANISLTGYTMYSNTNTELLERNHEEAEARMDELEGTLRGHIGLIEESLERIEKKMSGAANSGEGWGKGMGKKTEDLYASRGKDERKG